jgi:hypothetical protein
MVARWSLYQRKPQHDPIFPWQRAQVACNIAGDERIVRRGEDGLRGRGVATAGGTEEEERIPYLTLC